MNDIDFIYTNPLEETIRCAMCTNSMRSDTGCDGGCKVDERMYERVINAVKDLITTATKNLTNGDVIKAMFPSMETFRSSDVVEIRYKVHDEVWCVSALDIVWWDEPYKRGEEDANSN